MAYELKELLNQWYLDKDKEPTMFDADPTKKDQYYRDQFVAPDDSMLASQNSVDSMNHNSDMFANQEDDSDNEPAIEDIAAPDTSEATLQEYQALKNSSAVPKGPEGGFRASDYEGKTLLNPNGTGQSPLPVVGRNAAAKYLSVNGEGSSLDENPVSQSAPVAPQANDQLEKYLQKLKELQVARDGNMTTIGLGEAGSKVAQGISRLSGGVIDDNASAYKPLREQAGQEVKDYETLMKSYRTMLGGNQKNPWQMRTLTDPDTGVVYQYRINTITGEKAEVGQAGMAVKGHFDKETGKYVQTSGSDPNALYNAPQAAPEKKEYQLAELSKIAPQVFKDKVAPIKKEFNDSMKEPREVATSITNLNAKVGTGMNMQQIIDSGNLGSVQTQAAKMAGQKGVLTDQDLVKFAGAGGVKAWIDRFAAGKMGEMSDADVMFFRKFSKLMSSALNDDINNRSMFYADQIRQSVEGQLPNFTLENGRKWLSTDMVAPIVQGTSPNDVIKIKHKATGEIQSVKKDSASKYLNNPEFEKVE